MTRCACGEDRASLGREVNRVTKAKARTALHCTFSLLVGYSLTDGILLQKGISNAGRDWYNKVLVFFVYFN